MRLRAVAAPVVVGKNARQLRAFLFAGLAGQPSGCVAVATTVYINTFIINNL